MIIVLKVSIDEKRPLGRGRVLEDLAPYSVLFHVHILVAE